MIRLFVTEDLEAGSALEPSPEQARYLTQVMRRGLGDEVRLFNGRDGEWRARVGAITRRGCRLDVEGLERPQAAGAGLELLIAVVKRAPLEWAVEKATELGVARVRLVTTRRTNAERANLGRLAAIATEAAEQCGRLDVPEISGPEALERVLDGGDGRRLVFCDEGEGVRPMLEALSPSSLSSRTAEGRSGTQGDLGEGGEASLGPGSPLRSGRDDSGEGGMVSILIGPEGGFAPEERERLRALPFVTPVSLGPRILRAETAAAAALTLWQAAAGDWRGGLPGGT